MGALTDKRAGSCGITSDPLGENHCIILSQSGEKKEGIKFIVFLSFFLYEIWIEGGRGERFNNKRN